MWLQLLSRSTTVGFLCGRLMNHFLSYFLIKLAISPNYIFSNRFWAAPRGSIVVKLMTLV